MTDSPIQSEDQSSAASQPGHLQNRKILLGVSGGIACYKAAALTSKLVQQGADVRVVMTEAATRFVTPLTFQSLSGQTVITSIWQPDDRPDSQHIGLARWCDLLLIAPATANTMAKLANGYADDALSLAASAIPAQTPKYLAPAMNADMWANPAVQTNLAKLTGELDYKTIGPESGWQACRTLGKGRMSEPETIVKAIIDAMK